METASKTEIALCPQLASRKLSNYLTKSSRAFTSDWRRVQHDVGAIFKFDDVHSVRWIRTQKTKRTATDQLSIGINFMKIGPVLCAQRPNPLGLRLYNRSGRASGNIRCGRIFNRIIVSAGSSSLFSCVSSCRPCSHSSSLNNKMLAATTATTATR